VGISGSPVALEKLRELFRIPDSKKLKSTETMKHSDLLALEF
jgi:hypothetical protein